MAANMFVHICAADVQDKSDDGSKIDPKLKGEATEDKHKKWIVVKSVSWSVERAVDMTDLGSSQRGYANVNFGKLAVTSELSSASAGLMFFASSGLARTIYIAQGRVSDDPNTAMTEYLTWKLGWGQVTKYEVSCSEDGVPEETWEMAYRTVELVHALVDARTFKLTGEKKGFTWDLEAGKTF